jgi:hypothetical protein
MADLDYHHLLCKYMLWVRYCEGADFVIAGEGSHADLFFTADEWNELVTIAREQTELDALLVEQPQPDAPKGAEPAPEGATARETQP